MAIRGAKPKPAYLRSVTGNAGNRPLPKNTPEGTGAAQPPKKMNIGQQRLWDEFIVGAAWIKSQDSFSAYMWCCLAAEFQRSPKNMPANRISQLRALSNELGLNPSARVRLPGDGGGKKGKGKKYFR